MARASATSWVAVLVLLGACGSGSSKSATATTAPSSTIGSTSTAAASTTSSTPASTSTSTTASTTTTTRPAPSTTTAVAPSAVQVTDTDKGSTVRVAKGGSVAVVLHSTYWTLAAPSNPAVLQEEGQPTVTPTLQGCVPGQGCGTVSAVYAAVGPGQSQLSASRTSCGEALRCTGTQGEWSVTVDVTT